MSAAFALVDAGAGINASSARSHVGLALLASAVASVTRDVSWGDESVASRDPDATEASPRCVFAAAFATATGAARLATPWVSTISATAANSLDARGPRVAAALRATPSAPRASCASADARSDIARDGTRVARAGATRVNPCDVTD